MNINKIKDLKCVLFDMDGTVLDSEKLFEEAQIELLKELNVDINLNDLNSFKGLSHRHFYPKFLKRFNVVESIDNIRKRLRQILYKKMETNLEFIIGFEAFFKKYLLNNHIKVGIVTNTTRLSYEKIKKCINIADYFEYSITLDEAIEPKPSPKPYIQAMDHFSVKDYQTIIIEDSKTGLTSALKSNANVIGLTTTLTHSEIKSIDKNIIIKGSYTEIGSVFKNIKITH